MANTISSGVEEISGNFAGKTVGWLRNQLRGALNITPDRQPKVAGNTVTEEHVLTEDQDVDFAMPAKALGCR